MIKTILLLDDDPDEQFLLRAAFDALNVNVEFKQVHTLSALLHELENVILLPDLLLLDVNLPQQTGIEVIRILKAHQLYRVLPIVMYSNAGDEPTINECFDLGVGAYMKKTTTMSRLEDHLRTLFAWNLQTLFNIPLTERKFLN